MWSLFLIMSCFSESQKQPFTPSVSIANSEHVIVGCLYTAWDVSNCNLFPGPYFPVFRLNTGKYGQKKLHIWTFLRCNSQSGLLLKTVYRKAGLKRLATFLTHSNPMFYFYTSLETSENQTFSGIFWGYRNETLV